MLPPVQRERIEPGPGQESVWDYPRPPAIEPVTSVLRVELGDIVLAETTSGYRVLETSQPPTYYFPAEDVSMVHLDSSEHRTFCEWKGQARYWSAHTGERRVDDIAWSYYNPTERFTVIKGYLAFYAQKADACFVGGERVQPMEGSFYGGWITSSVVGPFKGGPGTASW